MSGKTIQVKKTEEVLDKDAFCNHVYSLDDGALRSIFANLFRSSKN